MSAPFANSSAEFRISSALSVPFATSSALSAPFIDCLITSALSATNPTPNTNAPITAESTVAPFNASLKSAPSFNLVSELVPKVDTIAKPVFITLPCDIVYFPTLTSDWLISSCDDVVKATSLPFAKIPTEPDINEYPAITPANSLTAPKPLSDFTDAYSSNKS